MKYESKYGHLIGFFLGEFQYMEGDNERNKFFKINEKLIKPYLNEVKELLSDKALNWKEFCDEANIYFCSNTDFFEYFIEFEKELNLILFKEQ